jgi:hypothetical protein
MRVWVCVCPLHAGDLIRQLNSAHLWLPEVDADFGLDDVAGAWCGGGGALTLASAGATDDALVPPLQPCCVWVPATPVNHQLMSQARTRPSSWTAAAAVAQQQAQQAAGCQARAGVAGRRPQRRRRPRAPPTCRSWTRLLAARCLTGLTPSRQRALTSCHAMASSSCSEAPCRSSSR